MLRCEIFVGTCAALFITIAGAPAKGQPVVPPGTVHTFTAIDSDGVGCRVGTHLVGCRVVPFLGTGSPSSGNRAVGVSIDIPDERRLSAGYIFDAPLLIPIPIPPLSVPHYSSASVYNDFTISGSGIVEVQISVTYDAVSQIFAGGAFKAKTSVTIGIDDVTEETPVGIASHELSKIERTNEQGFTDFSFGSEREVLVGETSSFVVKLRAGRTYRIRFSAEAMGEGVLAGEAVVFSHAGWQTLSVMIDEGANAAAGNVAGAVEELLTKIEALAGPAADDGGEDRAVGAENEGRRTEVTPGRCIRQDLPTRRLNACHYESRLWEPGLPDVSEKRCLSLICQEIKTRYSGSQKSWYETADSRKRERLSVVWIS